MAVSSYGSATRTSGVVRILKDLDLDLTDRDVLIVEDIVDSGLTLAYLRKNLAARARVARGVRAAREGRPAAGGARPEVRRLHDPAEFVVGYGLDVASATATSPESTNTRPASRSDARPSRGSPSR
jgi:hypoxanthine phosphoribosyltransferase